MNAWAIFWNFCAVVGLLSIVGSLGWFLFTWRVTASGEHDPVESPSEVVERFTNVRPFVPPHNDSTPGGAA